MTTYEQVYAGDVVLGHDRDVWGVESIDHGPPLVVTLIKGGGAVRVTGYPPAGTEVTVVTPSAGYEREAAAWQILTDAGLGPIEILGEVSSR